MLVLIHWYGNINAETVRESLLVTVIEAINCYRYCIIISLSSDIKKRCHCIRSAWFWIFLGSAKASLHVAYTGIPGARVFGLRWSGGSQVVSSLRPSLGRLQMFIVFALQKDCFMALKWPILCWCAIKKLLTLSSLFLKYTGIEQVLCKWIGEYTDHKWTLRYVGCTTRSVCGGASAVIFITTRTVNNVKRLFSAMSQ